MIISPIRKKSSSSASSSSSLSSSSLVSVPADHIAKEKRCTMENKNKRTITNTNTKNRGFTTNTKEEIRQKLIFKIGITEEEIDFALDRMVSSPFSQNEVINMIHQHRQHNYRTMLQQHMNNVDNDEEEEGTTTDTITAASKKFDPKIGLRVRVPQGGSQYYGTVSAGPNYLLPDGATSPVKMWTVTFDYEGTKEDYDFHELLRYRASRPIIRFDDDGVDDCSRGAGSLISRRRTLNALELFAGEGIVSQEFSEHKFAVKSIDIDPASYATNILDLLQVRYNDIGFVPDFIWASPDCSTYSNLAGGSHRNCRQKQYEKSPEAYHHNDLFNQMVYIMRWAKKYNPHLIVVIENPQGQMSKMPHMIEFVKSFGLHQATVHYCAFGRLDKKPTCLWTNDHSLYVRLSKFRCTEERCPYYNKIHPVGVRSHGRDFNAASIPQRLAEEVADYVFSKFYIDDTANSTPRIVLSKEDIKQFDRVLAM